MRHLTAFVLASVALLLAACTSMNAPSVASGPAPAPAPLDADGYVRQWLILGPINFGDSYVADDIVKEQIPHEAALTPAPGSTQTVKTQEPKNGTPTWINKTLAWTPVTPTDHVLDFNEAYKLETSDNFGAYAFVYLVAPEDLHDLTLSFSTNDDGDLFLNGKSIWSFVGGRALAEDSDTVEHVTLHKGPNPLLLKVWNDSANWQACLRVLDKSGKPVKNVMVQLAK